MEGDLLTWMKGLGIMAGIGVVIIWDALQNRKERKQREKEQQHDNQTQ